MTMFRVLKTVIIALAFSSVLGCSGTTGDKSKPFTKNNAKVLANDLQITTDSADQAAPAVAYDSVNGNSYLTVWTDNSKGSNDINIYGAVCNGSGTGSGTTMSCSPGFVISSDPGNQTQPKVAFYPNGSNSKYLVVWTDTRNGYGQIYGQFIATNGSPLGGQLLISPHDITATSDNGVNQSDPDIIYDPIIGKFVVAWVDKSIIDTSQNIDNEIPHLKGAKCSNEVDPPLRYVPLPIVDNNLVRTVEVDPITGGTSNIQAVSKLLSLGPISDSGTELSAAWTAQYSEGSPKLGYDRNGNYFTAWAGTSSTVTMKLGYEVGTITAPATTAHCTYKVAIFEAKDNDGGKPKVKIRQDDGLGLVRDFTFGSGNALFPTMATDPNTNRTLLAWEEDQQIKGQLLDLGSFVAYGPSINISTGTGPRTAPAAAFDNVNERFLVTWEDARNGSASLGNIDIYSQFIDPQGALSGSNTIVTVAPGNQLAPAVAFGDNTFRKFFVVWKDARVPDNSDVYGQLLEFSTLPQLLITDAQDQPILSGAIDFGSVDITKAPAFKDFPFKIRNDGNSVLTINSIDFPEEPFSVITPKPQSISPGTSADMTVRFAPTGAGSYANSPTKNYKMVFNSNGGNAIIYLSGSATGTLPLSVQTTSLPDGAAGSTYTTKLAGAGGTTPYGSWTKTSGNLPPGLTLDSATGTISGTIDPTANGTYNFTVSVSDNSTPAATSTKTLSINVTSVSITNTSLKSWTQNQAGYTENLTASGGSGALTWSISAGSGAGTLNPVPGLTLNTSSGAISGTPTAAGNFTFTVRVSDALGKVATKSFTLTVNTGLSVSTTSLTGGVINTSYTQKLAARGGTQPYTWTVVAGSLPPGFDAIDSSTGAISGTPTSAGTFNFTVQVADNIGATATKQLSIVINPPLDITDPEGALTKVATSGTTFTYIFSGSGGSGIYDWSIVSGSLPTGLSLNAITGMVSGTPTVPGIYTFSVLLKDTQYLNTIFKTYYLTVLDPNSSAGTTLYFSDQSASILTSLPFGNVFHGSIGKKQVTVSNKSGSIITISSVSSSDPAFFTDLPAVFDVSSNSSLTFNVSFAPYALKDFTGNIILTDTSGTQYKLALTGSGSAINVTVPAGNGTVGTVTPLTATQVPLVTMPSGVVGYSAGEFTITGITASPVTVTVTFDNSVMPSAPVFYAVDGSGKWTSLTGTLSGNAFTFQVTDNDSNIDKDQAAGSVRAMVVVAGPATDNGNNTGTATNTDPPPSSGSKSGCFIATAAYGSYLDPNVMVLRKFRDNVLLKSKLGTAFVKFYYANSPPVADFIREHEALRSITRWLLTPLIYGVKYPLAAVCVFLFSVIGFCRSRKRGNF